MDHHRSVLSRNRAGRRVMAAMAVSAVANTVALGVVAMFVAWPVLRIFSRGLSAHAVGHVFTDGRLRAIVGFTLVQAVLSTVGAVAVAMPAAWLVGRHQFGGRRLLMAVWVGPFTLPTVVVGLAARQLLPQGLRRGLFAIVCAHIFFNLGIAVRTIGSAWSRLDPRPEEAAATLGATPWQVFRLVTLPRLAPAMAAVAGLIAALCLTSFGVVLLLATPRQSTVEVEIWRQTTQFLRLDRAGALAMVQLVLVSVALVLTSRGRTRTDLRQRAVETRRQLSRSARPVAILVGIFTTVLTVIPMILLVERSLRSAHGGHGMQAYRSLTHVTRGSGLLDSPASSLAMSIRIAVPAAILATVLGVVAALVVGRGIGGPVMAAAFGLPLAVSAVTLGFGFLIAFARAPVAWRSRPWILPVLQAVVAMPFVQRMVEPAVRRMDPRLAEVAATLGLSPLAVWRRVQLPILARPILSGAGIAFAVALGEFGATTFLVRPGTVTMPVAIARLAGRPGAVLAAQSLALAVVLGALTIMVTVMADLAGRESR